MLTNNLLLLKAVSDRGSLLTLHKRGLTSSQIALLLEEQIEIGNIQSSPEGLSLTEAGENLLRGKAWQKILCKRRQAVVKETGANQRISLAGHNPA